MKRTELEYEQELSYDDLCEYLQNKYGLPQESYFSDTSCSYKTAAIKRTGEGLEIHHIDEIYDGCTNLSNKPWHASFESQLPSSLCYCNLLEHLLLHIKINIEKCEANGITEIIDGAYSLMSRLDNLFETSRKQSNLEQNMLYPIQENYSDYIILTNNWAKRLKTIQTIN